jgi:hypothetical protein
MDISKSISYRGLELNGATLETGRTLRGIAVEQVDYSAVDAVGYTEKRAGSDGVHASDVYLGGRTIQMSGHIYATSLAEMFDFLHVLRSVFSPTSAYQDSPGDRGFLPLHYQQSTLDLDSFPYVSVPGGADIPAGVVPLYMNVRPQRTPTFAINRDRQDTSKNNHGTRPTAIPWSVTLLAKDPRVYIDPSKSVDVSGAAGASNVAGAAINRGDYETPLNIMLVIGATVPPVGEFRVTGFNGIDMKIKIEAKANTVYRWMGDDRVLMTEDISGGAGTAPLVLRMDLVTFATKNRKPMVPASINPPSRPFSTPFHYWRTGAALAAGSRLFWSEAFA